MDPSISRRGQAPARIRFSRPSSRAVTLASATGILAPAPVGLVLATTNGWVPAAAFAVAVLAGALVLILLVPCFSAPVGRGARDGPQEVTPMDTLRQELASAVSGALAVGLVVSALISFAMYIAGQLAERYTEVDASIGGSDLAVTAIRTCGRAALELGLPVALWWVLTSASGRCAVAWLWLGAQRRVTHRRGEPASAGAVSENGGQPCER